MEATDLCVPIYLDQQMVFDLLAVLEDGFYHLSSIRTAGTESENQKAGLGASVGVKNVFALLGVAFKGDLSRDKGSQEQTEVARERVHTPTSLFSKLRLTLADKSLLTMIQAPEDVDTVSSGHFVEFRAVLRKNPLVETIEGFQKLVEWSSMFAEESEQPSHSNGGRGKKAPKGGRKGGQARNENEQIAQQMGVMLSALTQTGSLEIVGEMLDVPPTTAVLSTRQEYFSDENASEIVDGEFRVLGKVVRVVRGDSEDSINLLRKTSFGHLDNRLFDQLGDAFVGQEEVGLRFPEIVTEVEGPALQVIPIAIFT
jgi:hypothetical protein